jgi:putative thioredoxin
MPLSKNNDIERMSNSNFILDATAETFAELVIGNSMRGPVMVNYWSAKAGPCLKLWPLLEKLANEYSGKFLLVNLNTDKYLQFSRTELGITSVPTVKMYFQGNVVDSIYGAESEKSFRSMIDKLLPRASDPLVMDSVKLYQENNVEQAFEQLKKLQQSDFGNPRIPLTLIKLMFREKRFSEAIEYIKTLPKKLKENDEILSIETYGKIIITANNALDKEVLVAELDKDNEQVDKHYQLAAIYLVEDQLKAAMEEFLQVIRIDRAYENDIGVKGMVNTLNMIENEPDLVKEYRKKMISFMSG